MQISIITLNNNLEYNNQIAKKIEEFLGKNNIKYCCVNVE